MTEEQEVNDSVDIPEPRRSILEMSNDEARTFLLKEESYCSFRLPEYVVFEDLIQNLSTFLNGTHLPGLCSSKPKDEDHLNYIMFNNKDGKYAWRPLQLIHPVLYVYLVHGITEANKWGEILNRFQIFANNPKIKCLSLPGESLTEESDTAEQISYWWQEVEQKSIELALEYEYLTQTDITDCYGSIYTHSISWALHSKPVAKDPGNRNDEGLIGVFIDKRLQDMSNGQTNGIPQGSVLMDFIAEMVLGYADHELTAKIEELGIEDYQILRYRDDYRIFTNNPQDAEKILKALTEVLIDLNFKLNESKTLSTNQVIQNSIKEDKLNWLMKVKSAKTFQKHLLIIHNHSIQFPNSGSVEKALTNYYRRLERTEEPVHSLMPIISIAVDIAYHNPRTYPIVSAILSKLINMLETEDEKRIVLEKVKKRFEKLPNTGYMQIYLQRISLPIDPSLSYDEPLCKLISGDDEEIWNNNWISSQALKNLVNCKLILDQEEKENLPPVIPPEEVELFNQGYFNS